MPKVNVKNLEAEMKRYGVSRSDIADLLGLSYRTIHSRFNGEGYSVEVWDAWSKNDHRYHAGECEKKWNTFHGSNSPVTAGTIVQLAMDHGWKPSYTAYELGWDDEISAEGVVVDCSWVEGKEIHEPRNWNPVNEIIRYLETLFDPSENVGYVTGSWERTDEKGTRYVRSLGVQLSTATITVKEARVENVLWTVHLVPVYLPEIRMLCLT